MWGMVWWAAGSLVRCVPAQIVAVSPSRFGQALQAGTHGQHPHEHLSHSKVDPRKHMVSAGVPAHMWAGAPGTTNRKAPSPAGPPRVAHSEAAPPRRPHPHSVWLRETLDPKEEPIEVFPERAYTSRGNKRDEPEDPLLAMREFQTFPLLEARYVLVPSKRMGVFTAAKGLPKAEFALYKV